MLGSPSKSCPFNFTFNILLSFLPTITLGSRIVHLMVPSINNFLFQCILLAVGVRIGQDNLVAIIEAR